MHCTFFNHSADDGHVGDFQIGAISSDATANVLAPVGGVSAHFS